MCIKDLKIDKIKYFDTKHAIEVHSSIIKKSGGLSGVKNIGLLDSVLTHVKNDDYYPEFIDKITYLAYGINKNHSFNDGNKRASIALSSYFLELNNHGESITPYVYGMEEVAVWLASSVIDQNQLKKIIHFLIYDDLYRIIYFIEQSKRHSLFIEKGVISKCLLSKIIECLLSEEMYYSEEVLLELYDVLNAYRERLLSGGKNGGK